MSYRDMLAGLGPPPIKLGAKMQPETFWLYGPEDMLQTKPDPIAAEDAWFDLFEQVTGFDLLERVTVPKVWCEPIGEWFVFDANGNFSHIEKASTTSKLDRK